ncbi:MAG: biopolymer transporter ExbD [Candidatus Brocadiia bacterium]
MRLHFKHTRSRPLTRLDITPLIDVVFQLLIFFMLTSSYVLQAGIRVNLPSALESFTAPPLRTELFITAEDRIFFQGKELAPDGLLTILKVARLNSDAILIFADVDARHGRVVQVEDICQRAGFRNISVATQPMENLKR